MVLVAGFDCFKLSFCCSCDYLAQLVLHGEMRAGCSAEEGLVCK